MSVESGRARYKVIVSTETSPVDFKGPQFFRKLRSRLSRGDNTTIGHVLGMTREEAESMAEQRTHLDGYKSVGGKTIISRGRAVRQIS